MKKILPFFILIGLIVMTLTYVNDFYNLFVLDRFYEGYIFALKVLMFDVLILIPLIMILVLKNINEIKIWSILSIVFENIVLFLGFKIGSIFGILIGLIFITYFILNYKKFNLS